MVFQTCRLSGFVLLADFHTFRSHIVLTWALLPWKLSQTKLCATPLTMEHLSNVSLRVTPPTLVLRAALSEMIPEL